MSILIESLVHSISDVVKKGRVYEVGHPHGPGIPHHPNHPPFLYSMSRLHGNLPYAEGVATANDIFTTGAAYRNSYRCNRCMFLVVGISVKTFQLRVYKIKFSD